ncbi:hypothetical protein [Streptomyces sp. NPDC020983]|uniref:hypothetical protein n=1 Tax=Streptomyces sp. NPDC020983 TaxID=3365106 RepID=UPI0037AD79FE
MTSTTTHAAACGHTSDIPAQLCAPCTNRLRDRLQRLPQLHTALAAWLPPGSRRPEFGRASSAEAPLPLRETVLDLRGPGGIVGVLEDWQAAVHADRGFTGPIRAGGIPARIRRAAHGLQAHLTWVSIQWELATDLARELAALEGRCLTVINPADRSTPIGQCPTQDTDGSICGATIRVPAGTTDVYCHRCGTRFPPDAWLNLRRWMDHDQAERTLVA